MHDEPWQTAWNELTLRCERTATQSENAMRRATADVLQGQMTSWRRARSIEWIVGFLGLVVSGMVVAEHVGEARYCVAGAAVGAFCIAVVVVAVRLLVQAAGLDFAGPIATSQRHLEELHLAEFRSSRLWLLGGVVIWLPALLLGFEAATGAPVLRQVDLAWFAANLLFGIVVLSIGCAWSRRFVERDWGQPWAARLVDVLTGRPLQAARARLRELAEFVAEPPARR